MEINTSVWAGTDEALNLAEKARHAIRVSRGKLSAYKLTTYSKSFIDLYKRKKNAFEMKSASLVHAEYYWRQPDEVREIEIARRHIDDFFYTDYNIEHLPIIDDLTRARITVGRVSVAGPLTEDAAVYYDFSLAGDTVIGGVAVHQLRCKPKTEYEPLMDGVVYIAQETFQVVGFEIQFNKAVKFFPPPDLLQVRVMYAETPSGVWLPKHIQWGMQFNITFPWPAQAQWRSETMVYETAVNPEIPSAVYRGKAVETREDAYFRDSAFWADNEKLPMTEDETQGFSNLGQLPWNLKILNPDLKGYRKRQRQKDIDWGFQLIPDIRYNRVEGFFTGAKIEFDDLAYKRIVRNLTIKTKVGYGFADEAVKYSVEAQKKWLDKRFYVGGKYYDDLAYKEFTNDGSVLNNSLTSLVYRYDIYNYFYVRGYQAYTGVRPFRGARVEFAYTDRWDSSAAKNAHYALIKSMYKDFDPVYPINDGRLRRITVSANYTIGTGTGIAPRTPYWIFDASIDHANPNFLKSDFHFTLYNFSARFHIPTTRRGSLDGKAALGLGTDRLPNQYLFHLYGGTTPYVLKTVDFREPTPNHFQGNRMAALTMEHNFGGTLLERTDLPFLRDGYVDCIPTFSIGFVHASKKTLENLRQNKIQYLRRPLVEAGFAVGDIYRIVRLDFTWRLTQRSKGNRNFAATMAVLVQRF